MAISDTQALFGDPQDPDLSADKRPLVISSSLAMIVLACVAVVLRFLSRWVIRVPFLVDDWLILAALPFAICLPASDIYGATIGYFGRHLLLAPDPVQYLSTFLKGLYVYDICYNFAIALAKLSMLAIYWRIFQTRSFKLPLLATAGATIAWLISCTLVAILSCIPVRGFWDKTIQATCINNFAFYTVQAACNILLDLILLIIPIFRVFKLEISTYQKFAVSGIFLIGAFTTIASALRLNGLIRTLFVNHQDPVYDTVGSGVWSVIETNLSIICACLPTMRPLLRLVFRGSPYPTSAGASRGANRSSAHSMSDVRAKSRVAAGSNWPLPKRMSRIASPARLSFHSPHFGDGHLSPKLSSPHDRTNNAPWDGTVGRPLVRNPNSFTTNRYQHVATARGDMEKAGEEIEMRDRNPHNGDEVGVAIGTTHDEVSQYGGSEGTTEIDTVMHLGETRPVDGF